MNLFIKWFRRILLSTLLFAPVMVVFAAPPPVVVEWVYRVDTRPPEVVFKEGFVPWGDRDNLLTHLRGPSVNRGTSGFVSLTSNADQTFMSRFFPMISRSRSTATAWLYRVRANSNTYDVNASMRVGQENTIRDRDLVLENYINVILTSFAWQNEYANLGTVLPNRIISAQRWHTNQLGVVETTGEPQNNPEFIASLSTSSSPNVFPVVEDPEWPVSRRAPRTSLLLAYVDDPIVRDRVASISLVCDTPEVRDAPNNQTRTCNLRAAVNVMSSDRCTIQ